MKQLLEIMRKEHIATKWYELGVELLKDNTDLELIKVNHQNDCQSCCHEMFKRWLDVKPNANWSQLVTALSNVELTTAADAINKQYKTGNFTVYKLYICDWNLENPASTHKIARHSFHYVHAH